MDRCPTDTLTESEANMVRRLVKRLGIDKASRELGLNRVTLTKALARLPVHRLTATVIRHRSASEL